MTRGIKALLVGVNRPFADFDSLEGRCHFSLLSGTAGGHAGMS
jgi:hypothetical protein